MSETNTKPRRGPMGHGHGMGPGEKPKDFKNSIKKLLAYIGKYKIGILFVAILTMGLWKNERITELLWRLSFVVPMLKWLLDTVKKLNKDIN